MIQIGGQRPDETSRDCLFIGALHKVIPSKDLTESLSWVAAMDIGLRAWKHEKLPPGQVNISVLPVGPRGLVWTVDMESLVMKIETTCSIEI